VHGHVDESNPRDESKHEKPRGDEMSKSILYTSMSLDGFTAPGDRVKP